jgi:hypothetical protein
MMTGKATSLSAPVGRTAGPGPERIGELQARADHHKPQPQRRPGDQVDRLFERRIDPEGRGIDRNARRTAEDQGDFR